MADKFINEAMEIDLTELKNFIRKFPTKTIDRMLQLVGESLNRNMKIEAPVDEGVLRGSIKLPEKVKNLVWQIRITAKYWRAVQFGHKEVRPINAKALRFEIKGNVIFAKFARATKPNKFIDRAIAETSKRLKDFAVQAVEETVK